MSALILNVTMTTITCCQRECGIVFAVPMWWEQHRREDHSTWYCPNGHTQHFPIGSSDAEKERQRAEQAEAERDVARASRRAAWEETARQTRRVVALKGIVTRTKKRIAAGKCPCCHARFPNLGDHMATEHPGYRETP